MSLALAISARRWLHHWGLIGGGITIDTRGRASPWRVQPAGLTPSARCAAARLQSELLRELDANPDLRLAVGEEAAAVAAEMVQPTLKRMGVTVQ